MGKPKLGAASQSGHAVPFGASLHVDSSAAIPIPLTRKPAPATSAPHRSTYGATVLQCVCPVTHLSIRTWWNSRQPLTFITREKAPGVVESSSPPVLPPAVSQCESRRTAATVGSAATAAHASSKKGSSSA